MAKPNIQLQNKKWLYEQYVTKQRTLRDIGEDAKAEKSAVSRALKRFGINARVHTSKYPQLNDKEWLRRMYLDEYLSPRQIASLVGSTMGNVYSALTHSGIETRGYKEGLALRFPNGRFGEDHPGWKGGKPICIDCGNRVVRPDAVRCKKCNNETRRGEGNTNWRGGVTPENARLRASKEYKIWRRAVLEREDYTCRFCKRKGGVGTNIVVHADHIKPFAYFSELRLDINNGRCLCEDCHKKTDTWGGMTKEAAQALIQTYRG